MKNLKEYILTNDELQTNNWGLLETNIEEGLGDKLLGWLKNGVKKIFGDSSEKVQSQTNGMKQDAKKMGVDSKVVDETIAKVFTYARSEANKRHKPAKEMLQKIEALDDGNNEKIRQLAALEAMVLGLVCAKTVGFQRGPLLSFLDMILNTSDSDLQAAVKADQAAAEKKQAEENKENGEGLGV